MSLARFRLFVTTALIGTLLAVPAASTAASGPAPNAPLDQLQAGDRIPGQYIVVFEDSVTSPRGLARGQTEYHDGELGFVYRDALSGYSVSGLSEDDVEALRRNPRVKYVSPDHVMEIESEEEGPGGEGESGPQVIPTGIERIFAPANELLHIDGKDDFRVDADVAVIDTGIDREHPDLNVVARTSCVQGENNGVKGCIDDTGSDGSDHGTHVAGTIGALDNGFGVVGVAPGVRLWAIKVLDAKGFGVTSQTIAGVDWVTAHASKIEAANMSLGCTCSTPTLGEAIEASAEAGVVYAIAAGNSAEDVKTHDPAGNPDAITVSALVDYDGKPGEEGSPTCVDRGSDDTLATFSNYGKEVNVAAPGVCIYSSEPGGAYGVKSGTSMAAPHVAGAAVLLASAENPENLGDVEGIRQTIEEEGNQAWKDTSGDGTQEPLLDVGDEAVFAPNDAVVSTGKADILSSTKATLHGAVNPSGLETEYHFEYGPTSEYGASTLATGAGSGGEYTSVEATLEGLEAGTPYHYRLVAINSEGTFYGAGRVFGAPSGPTSYSEDATGVEGSEATFHGKVNPEGRETTYYFEYGTFVDLMTGNILPGYKIPVSPASVGSGYSNVAVSQTVTGLNSTRAYYYRPVAQNDIGTSSGVLRVIPKSPLVTTHAATNVGFDVATLNAQVNPNGAGTTYHFEYDTTEYKEGEEEAHGLSIPVLGKTLASPFAFAYEVKEILNSLEAGTTYHYRVVATNKLGTTYGKDASFTTASDKRFDFAFGSTGTGNGQLSAPYGVAADSSGNAWVVDTNNNRVQKFNSKGEYVSQFGTTGTGNGQFSVPTGIAIDSSGNLWVSDCGNDRVQKFNSKGEYVSQFGKSGTGNGQLDCPIGLAFPSSGYIVVVDNGNNRVQKLKTNGEYVAQVGSKGSGNGQFEGPTSIALGPSRIWVSDTGNDRVQRFNRTSLAYVAQFGSHGSGNGQFNVPSGLAVDLGGGLWVVDSHNDRVQRFDEEGNYLDQLGTTGSGAGQMNDPIGIAVAGNWQLLVVDTSNDRVQHWTQVPDPPSATTEAATKVESTSATLNAKVNPYGLATTYRFEYDTTAFKAGEKGHGTSFPIPDESIGSGYEEVSVAKAITGLKSKTKYYFRVVATNASGTTYPSQKTFTTP